MNYWIVGDSNPVEIIQLIQKIFKLVGWVIGFIFTIVYIRSIKSVQKKIKEHRRPEQNVSRGSEWPCGRRFRCVPSPVRFSTTGGFSLWAWQKPTGAQLTINLTQVFTNLQYPEYPLLQTNNPAKCFIYFICYF